MRFGIISDLHMEFRPWYLVETDRDVIHKDGARLDPDAFYLNAGDTQSHRNERLRWLDQYRGRMFTVMGNHDYYINTFDRMEEFPDSIEVDGIRIAGATLWTDLGNYNDWVAYCENLVDMRYMLGWGYDRYNACHRLHRAHLLNSGADVIVSHHCPSYRSVHEVYRGSPCNSSFATELGDIIEDMARPPALWVHGHTHMEMDYTIGRTRVICHPRGYAHERREYSPKYVEL